MSGDHLGVFTNVDAASDPFECVSLMDRAQTMSGIQFCRQQALAALQLRPGDRVLDVGCGTGDETVELALRVAPEGEAVGVDLSGTMIQEARQRWEGERLPVRFEQGDAQRLRFPDATFDACRAERTLCHVPDAMAVLTEMVRVTRPGGRIAAVDVDLEAVLLDSADIAFTRIFLRSFADSLSHGRIGRQLPRLFRQSGLCDVTVLPQLVKADFDMIREPVSSHFESVRLSVGVDVDEADHWWTQLQESAADGTFFMGFPMVVVSGRKPEILRLPCPTPVADP